MSETSELSLEEVNTWKVDALKLFCRGLKTSGAKAELVARVFAASEMGIQVQASAKELMCITEGKAYRLFDSGFLKEVFYHELENMDFCFLKAKCTHSMKVGDTPHTSWICSRKNGEIISAYCTCTAGYVRLSINGKIVLKEKHAYFAQIQGQMAVTKRTWCHFLVYTQKGYHLELIKFNNDYWEKIKQNLIWFYNKYLSE
ncbi:unnamed protein product [Pocillopora meandrina]|uniref:SAP domain-containing protein n=1 Tax=Pocillopora meandrina TaxID=46732 RepID=A0AAU9XHX7_9CNID|nr:unnamed protein product [Pocillopora meandrina]